MSFDKQDVWHDGLVAVDPVQANDYRTKAGYIVNGSTRFYKCPVLGVCNVNSINGAVVCAPGSTGVLCAKCSETWMKSALQFGRCIPCPRNALLDTIWPWILFLAVTIPGRVFWVSKGKRAFKTLRRKLLPGKNVQPVVLFKIVLGFYQILIMQPDVSVRSSWVCARCQRAHAPPLPPFRHQVYDFEFPQIYLDWLAKFQLLTFDLPSYVSIDCLFANNYHSKMYGIAIIATFMITAIVLQLVWEEVRKLTVCLTGKAGVVVQHDGDKEVSKYFSACLVFSYLIYPSCTAVFSQTFNCRDIDGVGYLTKDLSILCNSPQQKTAESVAGLMLVVFSMGLPALYFAMLVKHRPSFNAAGGREHAAHATGLYGTMAFFHNDYSPELYYWEVVELVRKLVLTAVTVQFPKGSMVQVVLGAAVIIVHVILLAHYKPFKRFKHTLLALFTYAMMLFVFLGGLTLKVKVEVPKTSVFGRGISTKGVAGGLVFALVSVLVLAIAMLLDDVRKAARAPVMRYARKKKKPVSFPMYSQDDRFHLFLSHVWSTGQDQVLAIKKELVLLVPSIRIFLDIENLKDIGGLEKNIEGSDMTLMFLSRGYFASWNCLREVRHALMVHLGCQDGFAHTAQSQEAADRRHAMGVHVSSSVVLVRETDEAMHGGQPMEAILQACPERIGCTDHANSYDGACGECLGFSVDVRAALAQHAAGAGPGLGVIEWRRVQLFKLVSLKQIVQSMLLASAVGKVLHRVGSFELAGKSTVQELVKGAAADMFVRGEIDSLPYDIARRTAARVLLHSGCHLTEELQSLLKGAVSGLDMQVIDGDSGGGDDPSVVSTESDIARILRDDASGDSAAAHQHPVVLVVVVHRGCFKDMRVVRSLLMALRAKKQIVLVHESDENNRGCDFGEVITTCPPAAKSERGFHNQKLFDPIAVQWTRGAHQAVSVRILALALGAHPAGVAGRLGGLVASPRAALAAAQGALAASRAALVRGARKPGASGDGGGADAPVLVPGGEGGEQRGGVELGAAGSGTGSGPGSPLAGTELGGGPGSLGLSAGLVSPLKGQPPNGWVNPIMQHHGAEGKKHRAKHGPKHGAEQGAAGHGGHGSAAACAGGEGLVRATGKSRGWSVFDNASQGADLSAASVFSNPMARSAIGAKAKAGAGVGVGAGAGAEAEGRVAAVATPLPSPASADRVL
jgi:hypothetical protein